MQPARVTFTVPDFSDSEGIRYSEIEIIVELDGDIRDAVKLADALQRPVTERP